VTVDLTAGTATGGSGSDTLSGIEDVNGSEAADDITGNASAAGNFLFGNGGNDRLNGGDADNAGSGGPDRFDGGSGIDTLSYEDNTLPTTVILAGGVVSCPPDGVTVTPVCTATNGVAAQLDFIVSNTIENAIMGAGDDLFTGSVFNNIVWPNGGQNSLTGAGGIDTVNYSTGYTAGVTVNLTGGGGTGGASDSIIGFANAVGTAFNDDMVGSDILVGGGTGANLLVGGKGNDLISANAGPDLVRAGSGNDRVRGGSGDDTLKGQGGKDNIRGSGGADDIFGGKGKDFCTGGGGNDFIKTCERPRHNGQGPNGPGLRQRI
jgi:Ca2+-binding RTX toxin-like protein